MNFWDRLLTSIVIQKLLCVIGLICLIAILLVIIDTPVADGYSGSIYEAYPASFWIYIVTVFICGTIIVLHHCFIAARKANWWILGTALIVLNNMLFITLPYFRGFQTYGRNDTMSHLGSIQDILINGEIGKENFYPPTHIMGFSFTEILGLPLPSIMYIIIPLFFLVFISGIWLVTRRFTASHHLSLVIFLLSTPLIFGLFHPTIHPSFLSMYLIPYFFSIYHLREQFPAKSWQLTVALLLILIGITFWHPISIIFLMLALLGMWASITFYRRRLSTSANSEKQQFSIQNLLLISFTFFFTWYISFSVIEGHIQSGYDFLVNQVGTTLAAQELDALGEANLTFGQSVLLGINRYGGMVLLLGFCAFISCIGLMSILLRKNKGINTRMAFIYSIIFLTSIAWTMLEFLGAWGENASVIRVARFALLMGPVCTGYFIYQYFNEPSASIIPAPVSFQRIGKVVVLGLVIVIVFILNFANIYEGDHNYKACAQVTQMELHASEWFGNARQPYIRTTGFVPRNIRRFEDFNFGSEESMRIMDRRMIVEQVAQPGHWQILAVKQDLPTHFNYQHRTYLGDVLYYPQMRETYQYMYFSKWDKVYPLSFPSHYEVEREYYMQDFDKVGSDPSTSQIYDNGDTEVWVVYRSDER